MIQKTQLHRKFLFQVLICFLLLYLISSSLFAQSYQPGFVINEEGDSLRGYVLFKDHTYNRQRCNFKTTQDGPVQEFLPSDIKAYGVDDIAAFRSAGGITGVSKNVFLEYILKGTPSLLYYGNTYYVESGDEWEELIHGIKTFEKNGKVYEREIETFKGQLLDKFSSCPDHSGTVLASSYDSKSLFEVFTAYYVCADVPYQGFISKGNLIQIKWGAGVKAQRNTVYPKRFAGSTYYFENSDPVWKPFYSPFLAVHLSYPRLNNRLSIRSGIAFHRFSYSNSEVNDRAGVDLLYEMELKASQIEIPLMIMYNLTKPSDKAIAPYIFAGTGFNLLISLDAERKTTTLNEIPLTRNDFSGRSSSFAIRGGLGTHLLFGNSLSLFSEVYVENTSGFAIPDDNDVILYRKAIGLSMGVYFK